MKAYIKRGARNAVELKMENELKDFIEKKLKSDPSFEFVPARNIYELKQYHDHYFAEDTEIISETKNSKPEKDATPIEDADTGEINTPETMGQTAPKEETMEETKEFIDPMLRKSPNIRSYVTETDTVSMPDSDKKEDTNHGFGSIQEPTNFKDAFTIPTDMNDPKAVKEAQKKAKEKPFLISKDRPQVNREFLPPMTASRWRILPF